MTWNVLAGAENRFDAVLSPVSRIRPDVLILQECLGWEDRVRLRRACEALGIPDDPRHTVLGPARPRGSGKRYHVALVSRPDLELAVTHNDPKFLGHCIIEARIGDLTLFGAHFDSHHENLRFVEARWLRSRIDPARFASGKFLLAGDLNSISRRDPYPADLAARVAAAGTDKFGHPPRFEVVDELEAAGWVDLLYARGTPERWITASRDRGGVHIDYRTDYLFASPALASTLKSVEVVPAAGASDHDAVVADFSG